MNISIIGMGYVGLVDAVCLTSFNNRVICLDISRQKIEQINNGISPIAENGLQELLTKAEDNRLIEATNDYEYAIHNSDISFISVDTPFQENIGLNVEHVYDVARNIANCLKNKNSFHTIVIRSTIMPNTIDKVIEIVSDITNRKVDEDFGVVINPELLREGSAIKDYFNPPYILLASSSKKSLKVMRELYKDIKAEIIEEDVKIVELIKLVNNAYHGLKVTFANEVGNIGKSLGIDSNKLMEVFCKDTILNISPYYFKPGFAYGGSCLPKDLCALHTIAKNNNVIVPVIDSISKSNKQQIQNAIDIVTNKGKKNIAVLGIGFKDNSDDLRSSPTLKLVKELIDRGLNVSIYDRKVVDSLATNKQNNEELGKLYSLLNNDLDDILDKNEVIVIGNKSNEHENLITKCSNKCIIDLVRQFNTLDYDGEYEGISWKI